MLLPSKAGGSGHRHYEVPGMERAAPVMIESCVFVAPDMNELYKRGACQNVRARERVCLKTLSLCGHDISCHQHSVHA